tara:strand:- start:730 stop:1383 length:654 start_codon:yes stop_codon:yes gene_type:complete
MSSIKLKHSGGNAVSLHPPTSAPTSSDVQFKLPTADGSSGQVLQTDGSGNLSWVTLPTAYTGVTMLDQWRVTSNTTGDQEPIQNNLERVDNARNALINAGMTVSSGIWTFPSTGIYEIYAQVVSYANNTNNRELRFYMYTTTDNGSNWSDSIHAYDQQYDSNSYTWATAQLNYVIDITNTSNDKIKFHFSPDQTAAVMRGDTDVNYSCFTFKKIAET